MGTEIQYMCTYFQLQGYHLVKLNNPQMGTEIVLDKTLFAVAFLVG